VIRRDLQKAPARCGGGSPAKRMPVTPVRPRMVHPATHQPIQDRRDAMSGTDKIKNKAEEVKGKVKEAAGKATGDESQEQEGRGEQTKSDLKQTGEKLKDTFKN
jgi:uncharacterized protein YjbJ (UPF0337 family)